MPAVCVYMRVFIFPKSLVWFKGSKYTPIASRHTLKSGVVSSVSRAWFGLNVSVPCHCPAKCFRRIFSQIRSGQYDVLADFDFFMIMKILNIDDTCISIKLILHYTTSTAVPTDWVTRVYLYTLLIIYFHKFHFMKNAFKKT